MKRKDDKRYSGEFKFEAVRMVAVGDRPRVQIARELCIRVNQLRNWRLEFEEEERTGAAKRSTTTEEDLGRLRRENAPLVVQEIFREGRKVICSNIGGMAEKVMHGVNGLHFLVGSAADLAHRIEEAAFTPSLWERRRTGISSPPGIQEIPANQRLLYRSARSRQAKAAAMHVASVGC